MQYNLVKIVLHLLYPPKKKVVSDPPKYTWMNTSLNKVRQAEESDEEELQQRNHRVPTTYNRKRITIQELANTVREIPRENNGTIQKKRYGTEPTWLDRYRTENRDQEKDTDEEDEIDLAELHSRLQTLRS